MPATNNKRIAKNTLFLYFRMGIIMLVTLYTSRVVLNELGVEDYGVYTVIGGVVAMLSFLNSCMTTSTQRYLNFELGSISSTQESLKRVFSTSLRIHLIIALAVIFLGETVGVWFVNNKLVIPLESRFGANVVYQTSLIIFCISILQVPFNAVIIAHERMGFYAFISVVEAILRLSVAFALMLVPTHKLSYYGGLMLCVQIVVASIYLITCFKKFDECSFSIKYDSKLFSEMSQFAGWNLFGSLAWLVRGQGMGIILNLFFGPVLNAAKGIADQVSTAVSSLNSNFQVALNPQIIKSFASHNISEMELLTYRGIKFSTLLQWTMALPLILSSMTILKIWLGEVPEYASIFVILVLFDGLAGNLFGTPLMTSLAATGKVRNYQIVVSLVLLLILPAAYFAMKVGMNPQTIFYLNIIFNLLAGIARFIFCKRLLNYSFKYYLSYVLSPIVGVIILSSIFPLLIKSFTVSINRYLSFFIVTIASLISSIVISWIIGFRKSERKRIKKLIMNKLNRNGENV